MLKRTIIQLNPTVPRGWYWAWAGLLALWLQAFAVAQLPIYASGQTATWAVLYCNSGSSQDTPTSTKPLSTHCQLCFWEGANPLHTSVLIGAAHQAYSLGNTLATDDALLPTPRREAHQVRAPPVV